MENSANMIKIFVNDKEYEVESGQTIMQALDKIGFHLPRLCYHPKLSIEGACRVCIVEVEGARNYVASCAYPVTPQMKIHTNTEEIRRARRDIVELIVDNHPMDCHSCERDSNCELQRLAYSMGIRHRHFEGEKKHYEMDISGASVVRNPDKCVLCGRCVRVCSEIQNVNALGMAGRGFKTVVMPAYNMPFAESVCSNCGQCINVCPTASFVEKSKTQELFSALGKKDKTKVVQFAPSVRAAIGEAFGIDPDKTTGKIMQGKLVAALRKLGYDYVFDTQFAADLTIMEEASEFVERLVHGKGKMPMITSCSSAWMKYVEQFHPDLLDNISTCKSPMSMLGGLLKTYWPQMMNLDPKDVISTSVMCCTAKKYEADRPELEIDGMKGVDIVVTTREMAWMIKSAGIDLVNIEPEEFDSPLGVSSGAGAIFGATGGVMEAAIRTAYKLATGNDLEGDAINVEPVRGLKGIKEAAVDVAGTEVRVAVAHGLGNASKLMDEVKKNPEKYHFIEVMGCPGGCVAGGGQPYIGANAIPMDENATKKRAQLLYNIDAENEYRSSHDNPDIKKLYNVYLKEPLSEVSHKVLHTHYKQHFPKGITPPNKLGLRQ